MKAYYRINELDFLLPDGWQDQSMHVFVLPAREGRGEAALAITRDASQPRLDIHEYTDRQLVEASSRFPSYKLIDRRAIHVDEQPAVEVICGWTAPGAIEVFQFQAIVKADGLFLCFTLSTKEKDVHQAGEAWKTVLHSIRRRALW